MDTTSSTKGPIRQNYLTSDEIEKLLFEDLPRVYRLDTGVSDEVDPAKTVSCAVGRTDIEELLEQVGAI